MEAATRYPAALNDLKPFRNYYALERVGEYCHRFEVLYSSLYCEREVNYVLMLRGNTPKAMGGYPYNGPIPAADGSEDEVYEGSPKMVDGEPERFKTIAPISEELKPLADAVLAFIKKRDVHPLKIRYDGCKRQITFNEIMCLKGARYQSYKQCTLTAFHTFNTESIECGELQMSVGWPRGINTPFIPFYPSESVQGRMLFCGFDKLSSFQPDWQRFSKIALGMIDRGERIAFPLIPAVFKFYVFYEIDCVGRKSLIDTRTGIPFKFFQDDEASCRVKLAFELSEVLQKTVEHTKEIAKLNLIISVALNLKEMRLSYKIKGLKKEHTGTIRFAGRIDQYEGQPVLKNALLAIIPENFLNGGKRKSKNFEVQIQDGQRYDHIDVNPGMEITRMGA